MLLHVRIGCEQVIVVRSLAAIAGGGRGGEEARHALHVATLLHHKMRGSRLGLLPSQLLLLLQRPAEGHSALATLAKGVHSRRHVRTTDCKAERLIIVEGGWQRLWRRSSGEKKEREEGKKKAGKEKRKENKLNQNINEK